MFATVNGGRLHYAVEGKGPPCLVPSMLGSEWYRRAFSAALRERLQLVFVDARGTVRSEALPPEQMTRALMLADLDALCARLGLGRVAVLGHSRHGWFPLAFALDYPERLSHAVLVGALPGYGPQWMARLFAHWDATAPP